MAESWRKWADYEPENVNRKEAWKRYVINHPECAPGASYTTGTQAGGCLEKQSPRKTKFGHSHRVGGIHVK